MAVATVTGHSNAPTENGKSNEESPSSAHGKSSENDKKGSLAAGRDTSDIWKAGPPSSAASQPLNDEHFTCKPLSMKSYGFHVFLATTQSQARKPSNAILWAQAVSSAPFKTGLTRVSPNAGWCCREPGS